MIMEKNEKLPSTHSLLDKLTIRIASGIDDEYKRKLSMQPSSIENKFVREPTLDIDKELIELENLIKSLQTEIVEMTKNADTPQSEYIPNNDIAETKVSQNIFDSLPPISVNDVEATFKSLWNNSNSDTTVQSNTSDVALSDDLKNELQKEIFGDAEFMNSLNDIKQSKESKPFDKVTDKNILSNETIDNSKNNNIKTGLIMRIFGSNGNTSKADNLDSSVNGNTSKADNLNPSVSQRILDIFSSNKSQSAIFDSKNEPEAINADSLLNTDNNIHKTEQNVSLDSTDGDKKSFVNNIVPKSQSNIASEHKLNPPKDSTNEDQKSSSLKNILSKIEQSFVNIIGTNKKNSDVPLIKNNIDDKTDSRVVKKESVIYTHKDSDSKTKIAHKLNVINIYIDTPKTDNYELPPTQNKTSVTNIRQGQRGKMSSTSMTSKNVSISQLKPTSGTDAVCKDNALQNTVHSCRKNKETTDIVKKGNSKSTSLLNTNNLNSYRDSGTKLSDIDNSSTEFIKTGIYQSNKRTISDTSVLKSQDRFDRPFESMKNELSKNCEKQSNKNLITKKISNTRISAALNDSGHNVHDCDNCAVDDSFDDCLDDAPDQITNNNNNSQIEKPLIVIQFSEQPNVLEKEIVITKPISSESNTFKMYTKSNEDLVKDKSDVYCNITGDVKPASKIIDMNISIDDKNTDMPITDDKIQSVLRNSQTEPKSQPIYINSTLITINNIDSNDDEFEDSQEFIQEPAAMETPKKRKIE